MSAKRLTLDWKFDREFQMWTAEVPARDHRGSGHYEITISPRPYYCDRGKWIVRVDSKLVSPLDTQEGFPRYYFKLENAKEETELWANERQEVKAAFFAQKKL